MGDVKIPLTYDSSDRTYNAAKQAFLQNVYVNKNPNGKIEVIKRPALNATSATAMGAIARATWGEHQYIAGDTTVYYTVTTPFDTAFTGATWSDNGRVIDFRRAGGNVVVVNPNTGTFGDGYTLNTTTHVMTAIADADFPPNNSVAIARGVADIDGFMCVLTKAGDIYNSNEKDATAWTATDFIGMQNPGSGAKFLTKYENHIVAFSDQSFELFYNAGNPSASILAPRRDLQDNLGLFSEESAWSDDQNVFWVSQSKDSQFGVYMIDNFRPRKISTVEIDQYLIDGNDEISSSTDLRMNGFNWQGRTFVTITMTATANYSLVYDTFSGLWYRWTFNDGEFSVAGSMKGTAGDLLTVFLRTGTQATFFDHEVFQDDLTSGSSTDAIDVVIQTPEIRGGDGEQSKVKFMGSLKLIGDRGTSTNNVSIAWTDDDYENFTTARTLDLSDASKKLSRCGSFHERAFKLTHTANLALRLESMEADIDLGSD